MSIAESFPHRAPSPPPVAESSPSASPSPPPLQQQVCNAVNLGWTVDRLVRDAENRTPVAEDELGMLSSAELIEVRHWEITEAVAGLGPQLRRDRLDPALEGMTAAVAHVTHCDKFPDAECCTHLGTSVTAVDKALAGALTAHHYKVGKAYRLGRQLAMLYRDEPKAPGDLVERFTLDKVAVTLNSLADLHEVLPPNVAGVVSLSLQMTRDYLHDPSTSVSVADVSALRLQGHRWRAMLTGGAEPTDLLETADYVSAARILVHSFVETLRHTVRQFWLPLTLIALLGAGGIAVSFMTASDGWQVPSSVLSFLAAFASGVRLVSPSMVRVAEKAGPKMWAEAVISVVAKALPQSAPGTGKVPLRLPSSPRRLRPAR